MPTETHPVYIFLAKCPEHGEQKVTDWRNYARDNHSFQIDLECSCRVVFMPNNNILRLKVIL